MKETSTRAQRGFGNGCFYVVVTLVFAFAVAVCASQRKAAEYVPSENPQYQRYDRSIEKPCSPKRRDCK